uniref:COMM domain-containing protein n=1 Tax=Peronospora matthiolae TaxID=2874970 RepID=A0AAV1TUH0_9STRA
MDIDRSLISMSRSFAVDERVLKAVALTSALSVEDFEAVCSLAAQLFHPDKQSKRMDKRTASKAGWDSEQMEHAVLAVAKIFMDATKARMSEHAFRLVMKEMSLPEQHVDVLVQLFDAHKSDIRGCISNDTGTSVPQYRNLEWRIDLELGIRFCRNNPKPVVTLRLDTATQASSSAEPQLQTTCLRVDYDGLKRMQHQLETALKEVESVHCSRVRRYI